MFVLVPVFDCGRYGFYSWTPFDDNDNDDGDGDDDVDDDDDDDDDDKAAAAATTTTTMMMMMSIYIIFILLLLLLMLAALTTTLFGLMTLHNAGVIESISTLLFWIRAFSARTWKFPAGVLYPLYLFSGICICI